ncbi:MAG: histidinol-phosphate transaminase [Pyrinomonadaceae bacterium]
MRSALNIVKPGVRELKAYALRPERASIKINQNENPWDAPARIKAQTLHRLSGRKWSRYPEFIPGNLEETIARFAGWKTDGLIAGNGSNELIQALLMVTVGQGKRVLICEPTFSLYRQISVVLGGEVISTPLTRELTFDVGVLLDALRIFDPQVTIICSPNNPTGCVLGDDDLVKLLSETRGLVVIDEAYHEFADHSTVPLLHHHANLIVLRTFSKAMALAGLRVGYLLGAPELTTEIRKAVLPYNLNAFSQIAAEVAIEMYEAELRPLVNRIIAERERLFAALDKIEGLTPTASKANFMVVRSAIDPSAVFKDLIRRDILVRDVSNYPMLKDYFRVTVGAPEENEVLIAALSEIFKARGEIDG